MHTDKYDDRQSPPFYEAMVEVSWRRSTASVPLFSQLAAEINDNGQRIATAFIISINCHIVIRRAMARTQKTVMMMMMMMKARPEKEKEGEREPMV